MKKIIIVIEHGGVREIKDLPENLMAEVRDYDVQYYKGRKLSEDETGKKYFSMLFTKQKPLRRQ